MLPIYLLPSKSRAKALGIPEGNFGSLALAVTSRIQNPCRRQTMPHPKRIEPVENLSEQAGSQSTQRKILRLKSSDARIEKREPLPVQLYLASLDDPRARERTVTEDVSPHGARDRKSTRLNSSHGYISYAVFCLKKKKKKSLCLYKHSI